MKMHFLNTTEHSNLDMTLSFHLILMRHKQTAAFNCKSKRHAANLPFQLAELSSSWWNDESWGPAAEGKWDMVFHTQPNKERLTRKCAHFCHQQGASKLHIWSFEFAGIAEGQAARREHCVTEVPHLFLRPFRSHNENTGLVSKVFLATLVLNVDALDRQSAMCH